MVCASCLPHIRFNLELYAFASLSAPYLSPLLRRRRREAIDAAKFVTVAENGSPQPCLMRPAAEAGPPRHPVGSLDHGSLDSLETRRPELTHWQ
jgi:hypothetical protein